MLGLEDFNTYGFGTAQIVTSKKYYGNTVKGRLMYHKEGCVDLTPNPVLFDTPIDAAKNGYYPCPRCFQN